MGLQFSFWQLGQLSLRQTGTALNLFKNSFLSCEWKIDLLFRDLMAGLLKLFQALGKAVKGNELVREVLATGIWKFLPSLSSRLGWMLGWGWLLAAPFVFQVFSKDIGRRLNFASCINFILKKSISSVSGNTLNFLNRGSVCALYLAAPTILMACFCFFSS